MVPITRLFVKTTKIKHLHCAVICVVPSHKFKLNTEKFVVVIQVIKITNICICFSSTFKCSTFTSFLFTPGLMLGFLLRFPWKKSV